MANANVLITGDEKQFVQSLARAEEAERRVEKQMDATGKAGEQAGERTGRAMEKAGRQGKTEFDLLLRELRKTGPEGRKQAAQIEKHLQATGKQGRQSMESIIGKIGQIDPEAAKAAGKADQHFDKAFGGQALAKLTAFAGGFVSVGSAVQTVNRYFEEQVQLMNQAKEAQLNLANAQADAAKNLIGLGELERSELLQDAVASIASETGFSDLSALTTAIGSARSAGGTEEQVVSAVRAAASLTQLTPQNIDEFAGAGIDLARATGVDDAEQNLGLLLTTGTQSRVVDPLALAKELAPAVNNAVAQTSGQDRVEASREAAALFATFTQQSTDVTGAPSRTATIQFSSELGKFFSGLDQELIDARSRLTKLDAKAAPTEAETAERDRLARFIQDAQGMQDSGSLFGRIQALQQNEGIREQFFSREFGEASFKTAFKQLGDATSETSQMVIAAKEAIKADSEVFRAEVQSEATLTPQLRLGMFESQSQANLAIGQQGQTESAQLAQIRNMVTETLRTTQAGGFGNWLDFQTSTMGVNTFGSLQGGTAVEEAFSGLELFQDQAGRLQAGGLVGDEAASFEALSSQSRLLERFISEGAEDLGDEELGSLRRRVQIRRRQTSQRIGQAEQSGLEPAVVEQLKRNDEALRLLGEKLDRIANSTDATAGNTSPALRPPNYSSGLQAGAAGAALP